MPSSSPPSELFGAQQSDDSMAVDHLLSNELLQLSIQDRNALEEEIHGVRCLAQEETPDLISRSLHQMETVLMNDLIIPPNQKREFLNSLSIQNSHVQTDDFRLRFLRLTLFDATEAARRMVKFLEVGCHFFGDFVLERPVMLTDLSKKEAQSLRNGSVQFLPFRDRAGRRILVIINPSTHDSDANESLRNMSREERRNVSNDRLQWYIVRAT